MVKNPPANAGDIRDSGSIPGSGRVPRRRVWQHTPIILAWNIPWTEEPGPWGHKESDTTEATEHAGRRESETTGTLPDASSQKHVPAQNKQGVGVVAPDTP